MFKVGQKVKCIVPIRGDEVKLERQVYTIRGIFEDDFHPTRWWVLLVECTDTGGFWVDRFVPIKIRNLPEWW